MHTTFALLAALASVASVAAAPAGCSPSYSGTFEITAVNITMSTKRSLSKRAVVTLTLENGILKDEEGRLGYIAANNQFQFDFNAQPGALITSGWSACSNGSLALGPSALFYQCLSGTPSGTQFANLYNDEAFSSTCNPALIEIMGGSGSSSGISAQPDGQPTAATASAVTQISDGQVQASTGAPVTQITDGQVQAPTGTPVTQISDGQVQAPTGPAVTQIGDGQVQAPTGPAVTQIGDGQVQAPTGAPVTQISDGQVQAPTATGAPVTQITDGQVQAPTGAAVTQISDGQVQAPTGTGAITGSSSVVPFLGSGNSLKPGIVTAFVGVVVVAALL